ncbi:UDP-glycosyltransferase 74F1-like [Tripterygium wilfordii]|uniref:Glycosyltransferase n=1 Tax=Tripterygium wilfordii TaxID=458696 RepID=A0A7J7DIR8_TRIWF|nr:UDP-glycosyltransferase 74G1-like [Tripterygium wilfordii]KAF5746241.1 UDP-glycosyltransferase 74F1-like [Tripterygium wilfordii]
MEKKAHVLLVPFPAQGHITPVLQFYKRLVSKGVKATLVTTTYISNSTHSDPSIPFDIETISDGFDDGGYEQAENPHVYFTTFKSVGSQTLANLIRKLKDSGNSIDALIYDGSIPWARDVAKQFGVLGVLFFTQSCAVNSIYYHVNRGLLRLPLLGKPVSLPGLPLLEASETPSFIGSYGSYPTFFDVVVNQFSNIDDADTDWVLCSTFYELEKEVVDWMARKWRVKTIGPTLPSMYLDKQIENDKAYGVSLFNPDTSSVLGTWLDNKPTGSIVYVSFGSLAELGAEQMEEIGWGLKQSNCYFLWVVRASEQAKLPNNFIEETSEKGLVVTWCPQLKVLAHESIGCFVTHCGFNSVLEALSLGVPMVAMPRWTDQTTNAMYVENVWRTGIRVCLDDQEIVRKEVLEECIRRVLWGDEGKEIKKNANKWRDLAKEAIDVGGSSDRNIDEFVAHLVH